MRQTEEYEESKRQSILSAAASAVTALGYDAVRLSDIAKVAEVSIGTLQHYFDTRDVLLTTAFERASDDLLRELHIRAGRHEDPWEQIVALTDVAARDPNLQRRAARWTQFASASSRHPVLREPIHTIYAEWRGLLDDAISRGIANGTFTLAMPKDDAIDLLIAEIDGTLMALTAGVDDRTDAGKELAELVLRTAALLLGVPQPNSVAA